MMDLPPLQVGRSWHGCSFYDNDEGTKVDIDIDNYSTYSSTTIILQTFLVTGGWIGSGPDGTGYLSSTELLVDTDPAWVFTRDLPSPGPGILGANIDNRVLMTGK